MDFRTREHYENRLRKLKNKSETVNANLIRKANRNLKKFSHPSAT